MLIAILNQSTLVSGEQALAMTRAVEDQVIDHFAEEWERVAPVVAFYTDPAAVPAGAHGVAIVDTIADVPAGVLGFHSENPDGSQWGIVAAKPPLDAGAEVLTGDWSVSSILSHEVLELAADPSCTFWGGNGHREYALEICDPVEAPTYELDGVSVSNFTTPAWFDPQAPAASKFDWLGLLHKPFSLLPGGYVIYASEGRQHQQYGTEFPAWRRDMKGGQLARTHRRSHQG